MAPKFEFFALVLLSSQALGESWTDDFTKCNMYRLIE